MGKEVRGYSDMYTILSNERKLGGAIEALSIKLRNGEEYMNPVITHIDYCGSVYYSLHFIDKFGKKLMVHVNEIGIIESPSHKKIHELNNEYVKKLKQNEKLRYIKRLCELNEGFLTEMFVNEVKMLANDIGYENIPAELNLTFLVEKKQIVKIA